MSDSRPAPARVVLLTDDLLFGSKVEQMIREAGAEPLLTASPADAQNASAAAGLLIVDLVTEAFDGIAAIAASNAKTLAYYAHTDDDRRRDALAAGCEQVVPRSRMMREGARLIAALLT